MAIKVQRGIADYTGNFKASAQTYAQGMALSVWIKPNDIGDIRPDWPGTTLQWMMLGYNQLAFGTSLTGLTFHPSFEPRRIGGPEYYYNPNGIYMTSPSQMPWGEWHHLFFKCYIYKATDGSYRAKYKCSITDSSGTTIDARTDDYPYTGDIQFYSSGYNASIGDNAIQSLGIPTFQWTRGIPFNGYGGYSYTGVASDWPELSIDRFWLAEINNLDEFDALSHTDFHIENSLNYKTLGTQGAVNGVTPLIYCYGNKENFWVNRGSRNTGSLVFSTSSYFVTEASPTYLVADSVTMSEDSNSSFAGGMRLPITASIADDNSQVIIAPGRILLGSASLGADIYTDRTGLADYTDTGYFDTSLGNYIEIDGYKGFYGNVSYSGLASLVEDVDVVAIGSQIHANNSWVVEDDSYLFPDPAVTLQTTTIMVEDVDLSAVATRTAGAQAVLDDTFNTAITATNIIDIGQQYAADWVGLDQDYVTPYYYFTVSDTFNLYAAATVEIVPYANLVADCDITGQGGYFLSFAQSLISADTDFNIQPYLTGGAGILFKPSLSLSADTDLTALGGRQYVVDTSISADFDFTTSGGNYRTGESIISADTDALWTTDVFKSTSVIMDIDASVVTQGGKYWSAQWLVNDLFDSTIIARIISIDEYYIDKVTREVRNCLVFEEQRKFFIPLESQTLTVFDEDRINQVGYEPRQLRPEPGTPIQVGSRNRRITA
jgi:hypothetical protein